MAPTFGDTTAVRRRRVRWSPILVLAALSSIGVGHACAETGGSPQTPIGGYLGPALLPQVLNFIPPPPKPSSWQAKADLDLFRRTRRLQGGPRWRLAQKDVTDSPLDTFACALGVQFKPGDAPALDRLLDRLGKDRGQWVDAGKFHYATLRPYLMVDGPICEAKTEHLKGNPDYPSGHAAAGWSVALVLAELAPARAGQVLTRGRVFTESRIVCGSHTKSAVDAGAMLASALIAAEHGSDDFQADLSAARQQLADPTRGIRIDDKDRCRSERVAADGRL